jgi:fluoride exporter
MSGWVLIGVAVAGGFGAIGRFVIDGRIAARLPTSFPAGTLVVNLSGSLALGILVGVTADEDVLRLAATGLLGAYTTFSTWMFETQRLGEDGESRLALSNLAISLIAGVAIGWAGMALGKVL